jgi:hypothetical protein
LTLLPGRQSRVVQHRVTANTPRNSCKTERQLGVTVETSGDSNVALLIRRVRLSNFQADHAGSIPVGHSKSCPSSEHGWDSTSRSPMTSTTSSCNYTQLKDSRPQLPAQPEGRFPPATSQDRIIRETVLTSLRYARLHANRSADRRRRLPRP